MQTAQLKKEIYEIFTDVSIKFSNGENGINNIVTLSYKKNERKKKLVSSEYDDFSRLFDDELMKFFDITDEFKKQLLINWYKDFFNNLTHIATEGNYGDVLPHVNWYDNFVVCDILNPDGDDYISSIYFLLNSKTFQSLLSDEMQYVNRILIRQLEDIYGAY